MPGTIKPESLAQIEPRYPNFAIRYSVFDIPCSQNRISHFVNRTSYFGFPSIAALNIMKYNSVLEKMLIFE